MNYLKVKPSNLGNEAFLNNELAVPIALVPTCFWNVGGLVVETDCSGLEPQPPCPQTGCTGQGDNPTITPIRSQASVEIPAARYIPKPARSEPDRLLRSGSLPIGGFTNLEQKFQGEVTWNTVYYNIRPEVNIRKFKGRCRDTVFCAHELTLLYSEGSTNPGACTVHVEEFKVMAKSCQNLGSEKHKHPPGWCFSCNSNLSQVDVPAFSFGYHSVFWNKELEPLVQEHMKFEESSKPYKIGNRPDLVWAHVYKDNKRLKDNN